MILKFLIVFIYIIKDIHSLDNGLALTPPMGWMHWERFRCLTDCEAYPGECINEDLFKTMADVMVSDGYLDAGYEYIIIDDCWSSKERDEDDKLQPDPKRFPNGIKHLSDYIHSKGLKFGIYGDYGTQTCAHYPGSKGYLKKDAETFANWGVDYLKLDGCNTDYETIEEGYLAMKEYLNQTGRPIVFSCSWPAYQEPKGMESDYAKLAETCNLWRNWDDIEDSWASVTSILKWFTKNQGRIANFSAPGHWNDPDMLIIGNYGLSYEQSKAQMAIWAVMAAPLIMSVDLRTIEPKFKDILLNKNIIAVNQDKLGKMGKLVLTKSKIDIWTKPILPQVDETYNYAIGFMSQRVDGYPYRLNFTLSELNIRNPGGFTLTDLFDTTTPAKVVIDNERIFLRVKPSGGALLLATPNTATSTSVSQI